MAIMKNSYHPHYHTLKLGAGIGLGIVAALDVKPSSAAFSSSNTGEILIKHSVAVSPLLSPRSDPFPVITKPGNSRTRTRTPHDDDEDENFTYVTCSRQTNSVTRVYHHRPAGDGGVKTPKPLKYSKTEGDDNNNNNNNNKSDFLSSCDMCSKTLEGKDIYMYRGEKAFCSGECRERQIASDERKEKMSRLWKRKVTSSSEMMVSRSPCYYETDQIRSSLPASLLLTDQ